jgi:glucose-6-phosphate 1-dehydrogenase
MRLVAMPSIDEPFSLIIFGASGDLTRRKLVPALWSLYAARTLPEPFAIVAVARTEMTSDDFRRRMRDAVREFARIQPPSEQVWDRFASALHYLPGDPTTDELYPRLEETLGQLERGRSGALANRLFYCATPPSLYDDIILHLGSSGLARQDRGWSRIVIEKPFGHDAESARALNRLLADVFPESQVYRIDHYLGKETVQNLLVFRFANGIFEPIWNRNHVSDVQVTVAETIGVEGRGSYYEEAGALRDMMQNHLLQLLCLIAMEPPVTFDATPVREEKNKVLNAIRPIDRERVADVAVRGQYGPGFINNKPVPGYRQEKGVAPDSRTETYAAVKLEIDSWRWAGVPFYLRTGKRLSKRVSEIAIRFRRTPHMIFRRSPEGVDANELIIRIQPDEGIALTVLAKTPGPDVKLGPVTLDFDYNEVFGGQSPEAYERLLLDAIHGDATLYARGDWVEQAWDILMPVLDAWQHGPAPAFPNYEAGSWGPAEADAFVGQDRRIWRQP